MNPLKGLFRSNSNHVDPKNKNTQKRGEKQQEIENLVGNYLNNELQAEALKKKKAKVDNQIKLEKQEVGTLNQEIGALGQTIEKQKKEIAEAEAKRDAGLAKRQQIIRMAVSTFLPKVFDNKTPLTNTLTQDDLDTISFSKENKCLTIDEKGMKSTIIPFIKKNPTKIVDLTQFKDEVQGKALVELFRVLPETKVEKVIVARKLTSEEQMAKAKLLKIRPSLVIESK